MMAPPTLGRRQALRRGVPTTPAVAARQRLVRRAPLCPRVRRAARVVGARARGGDGSNSEGWGPKAERVLASLADKLNLRLEILLDDARRTAERVDRKFKVRARASDAKNGLLDRASSLDRQYRISTTIGESVESLRRNYPELKRKTKNFAGTTLGQVVIYGALIFAVFTGLYLRVLYLFFMLSLFAPLLLPLLASIKRRNEEAESARGAAGGDGSIFDMFNDMANGRRAQGANPRGQRGGMGWRGGGGAPNRSDDIVIDAEWTSVSEDDDK